MQLLATNCPLKITLVTLSKDFCSVECSKKTWNLHEPSNSKSYGATFILAHFNYCPLVRYFTSAKQVNKMEKIQERAFRFITDDYSSSYKKLPNDSNTSTMAIKRVHSLCTEILKSQNNLNAPYMRDLFHRDVSTYSLRSSNDLSVPRVNQTTFGLRSIRYEGAVMWNHLPKHFKTAENIGTF